MNTNYITQIKSNPKDLKIAIYDSEELYLEIIKNKIFTYMKSLGLPVKIFITSNTEFLIERNSVDIFILDIKLVEYRYHYVKILKQKNIGCNIIFTSWHDHYMRKVMYDKPFAFLRKNYLDSDLNECLNEINNRLFKSRKYISLSNGTKNIIILLFKVKYFQSCNHNIEIHWIDNTVTIIRNKLDIIENYIDNSIFLRTHKSFLVNIEAISHINLNIIYLNTYEEIPVSKKYKKLLETNIINLVREDI